MTPALHWYAVRAPPAPGRDDAVRAEVNGLTIDFERVGTGPVVVLTPGFVGDARATWGGQIEALRSDFTVIAWNPPGVGASSDPPGGFGMDAYADTLAAFLGGQGVTRAHLVGLSFGAALGLATFHRHRSLALSLALVAGYAGWVGSLGAQEADERLARSLAVSELPPDDFVAAMAPSMFSTSADPERVAPFLASVRASRPVGFRAMARASHPDQGHVLPEVDVPTLLLYADHDVRAPAAVGENLAAAIPGSELVVLQGPGHVIPVEAPDALRAFLRAAGAVTDGRP